MSTAFDAHIHEKKREADEEWVKRIQNEPMVGLLSKFTFTPILASQRLDPSATIQKTSSYTINIWPNSVRFKGTPIFNNYY